MNLRKLLREKKRQKTQMMKNTYVIQKARKPSYYKTKLNRGRKIDLEHYRTQRHANSTEVIGKNKRNISPDAKRSIESSRAESPGTKAMRMKKKILSMNSKLAGNSKVLTFLIEDISSVNLCF